MTSTSKLLMMDSRDLSNQGYPSADALVAAGFYCALLATGPETSNVVTLRVALPKASVPLLGNWREIKVHWDEKRQTVREGSIMGYVLHRSLGVWYCCTEEEAKEARERDAGQ